MIACAPALTIRAAVATDIPALEALIERSARAHSVGFYTTHQIEAAIAHIFGVDSELVADGTYLIAACDGALAGCGGWSGRATLFGADRFADRSSALLDPVTDAARIRAFFVAEGQARRGVGRALLAACERAAANAGFRTATLMATLPGEPFYATQGYRVTARQMHDCGGVAVPFVAMTKPIVLNM